MSVAQLLGHLRMGDVIIVPGSSVSSLPRRQSHLQRGDVADGTTFDSHKLLRSLIAVRLDGGKKK